MDQLNSMFVQLKRSFSSGGGNSQPKAAGSQTGSAASGDEGFLLIDQNGDETEIVFSSTPEKMAKVPDMDSEKRGFNTFVTHNANPVDAADIYTEESNVSHSATCDIPFKLNPKLQQKEQILKSLSEIDFSASLFDWQKYYYDFDFEQSSLQDLCSTENNQVNRRLPSNIISS